MSRVLVESGIEWIGKYPAEWNLSPLRGIVDNINEKNNPIKFTNVLSLTNKLGVVPYEEKGDLGNISKEDISQYKIAYKDTVIINSMNLKIGSVGYSNYDGCVSPVYYVLKNNEKSDISFINYIFQSNFQKYLGKYGKGILEIREKISMYDILHSYIPVPSLIEQKRIASYLDKICKKINEIINDNNHEIELLEEYKKTLITEVITSGLNKNSTFKESQIPWMGKIPSHYEVVTLKRLGTARNGLSYSPGEVADNGILVLRSSNIQNNKLSLNDNVYVKKEINEDLLLKENDLLICSRNGSKNLIGKNILINKDMEGQTFGAFMCVYRSKYNKYIRYVLNSHIFDYYLANFLTSTINQLTTSNLYSIKIPFTYNIEEQEKIIKYLDKQCSKLDSVIEYRKQIIEKLEEYKRSLIYECVTGKREV